jgi:hypothetical protein
MACSEVSYVRSPAALPLERQEWVSVIYRSPWLSKGRGQFIFRSRDQGTCPDPLVQTHICPAEGVDHVRPDISFAP